MLKYRVYVFIILIFLLIFGCKNKKDETKKSNVNATDSSNTVSAALSVEHTIVTNVVDSTDQLYIDLLYHFYDSDENYLPLYFKSAWNDSISQELESSGIVIPTNNAEYSRKKIDDQQANIHFNTSNLNSIVIFNTDQEVVDTLYKQNFEIYADMISSQFIVSYTTQFVSEDNVAISLKGLEKYQIIPSPQILHDSLYFKKIINNHHLKVKNLYGSGIFVIENDTLAYLSYSNYENQPNGVFLYKNGQLVDDKINDFIVTKLTPVPLATHDEILYVANAGIPDSDVLWTVLIGIDLHAHKFKIYNENRLTRE